MQISNRVNDAWKAACKVIFTREIGELKDYEKFLKRYVQPIKTAKSSIGGKQVYFCAPYNENAKFISQSELMKMKVEPIEINDLKDVDSLLGAVGERFRYSGDKIGGKFEDVVGSEDCADANFVFCSSDVFRCDNVAYTQMVTDSKYVFGCAWGTNNMFTMNCSEFYKVNRSFESTLVTQSSDIYYSYNCNGCQELMFCMNQKSTRYAIGNSTLLPDKYRELKKKLVEEIAEMLEKKKTAPPHIEVLLGVVK